jgi:hypothetical protein
MNHGQSLWLAVVSPLVCIPILCLAGGAYAVLMAAPPLQVGAVWSALFDGVAYSLILALPVGSVFGVAGALLASGLGEGALRKAGRRRWIRAGAGLGSALGILATACFGILTADVAPRSDLLLFSFASVGAGACAGTAVGWLAWREYGV